MALLKCPECSKDFSSDLKACPHCGKKRPQSAASQSGCAVVISGLVAVVVIFVLIKACSGPDDGKPATASVSTASKAPETSPPKVAEADRPIYETTAPQLYADYESNEVATDAKIGNAIISISGVVTAIDKDFRDHAELDLDTGQEYNKVRLQLVDSDKPKAALMHKGERIVARCNKFKRIIGTPHGTDCTLITP